MSALIAAIAFVVAHSQATLQWTEPASGAPAHYEVRVSEAGQEDEFFVTTQPSITLEFTPGRNVTVQVSACSDTVCGPWSTPSESFSLNHSADLTGDSVVGVPDYMLLVPQVGGKGGGGAVDLDGDGVAGKSDLELLRQRVGQCVGDVSITGGTARAYLPCDMTK